MHLVNVILKSAFSKSSAVIISNGSLIVQLSGSSNNCSKVVGYHKSGDRGRPSAI